MINGDDAIVGKVHLTSIKILQVVILVLKFKVFNVIEITKVEIKLKINHTFEWGYFLISIIVSIYYNYG